MPRTAPTAGVFRPTRNSDVNPTKSNLSKICAVHNESDQSSQLQRNHMGLTTQDAERLVRVLPEIADATATPFEHVLSEGVRFEDAGKLMVIEALGPDSPLTRYLCRREKDLHHAAIAVTDIDQQFRRMRSAGFTPFSEQSRNGAGVASGSLSHRADSD